MDLGLIHSSVAKTLVDLYLLQLRQKDLITSSISPNFLVKTGPMLSWIGLPSQSVIPFSHHHCFRGC
jgi:hypothetical protein